MNFARSRTTEWEWSLEPKRQQQNKTKERQTRNIEYTATKATTQQR